MAKRTTYSPVTSVPNPRTRAVAVEMRDAGNAMQEAEASLRASQALYELAIQRFNAAHEVLTREPNIFRYDAAGNVTRTVAGWMAQFHDVRQFAFTALGLGEAIEEVLKQAYQDGDEPIPQAIIHRTLLRGGFQFKTGAPLRQINAALLKLKNVKRLDDSGMYCWDPPDNWVGEGA